jgi:hypothetical protein
LYGLFRSFLAKNMVFLGEICLHVNAKHIGSEKLWFSVLVWFNRCAFF